MKYITLVALLSWGWATAAQAECEDPNSEILAGDLNADCQVDLVDYALFVSTMGACTTPGGDGCVRNLPPGEHDWDRPDPNNICYELPGPITVDGDLSEWDGAQWFPVRTKGYQADLAAFDVTASEFAIYWDPTDPHRIYAAARVTDTEQFISPVPSTWKNDLLELRIEATGIGTANPLWWPNQTLAQMYRVSSDGTPTGSWATWGRDQPVGVETSDNPDSGLLFAARIDQNDPNMLYYEAALQTYLNWGEFDGTETTWVDMAEGSIIRFDAQVNSTTESGGARRTGAWVTNPLADPSIPAGFLPFRLVATGNLPCGEFGYLATDFDQDCTVGLSDLLAGPVADWLSCTDLADPSCDL